ncbi:ABC transporter permease [Brachybacterium phenoliresistens]|uniref:ABC transporter permease n=1 Tax=Brachybacterium phenoliresistens TaxID=396014 RepID=Z9JTJ2_9MICO|nr:ABC transporter permease subunit [Brachybacterium phenoliresistens]EWS81695.1 ABC transporter permease [Brachybacterium phenoliresistens]
MSWVLGNLDVIGGHAGAHLLQALPAIVLAFVLALPVAKLAGRLGVLRGGISTAAALMYAIPSLPLFIVLPIVLGTSIRSMVNVIVALTLYGLALMVPAAIDAFRSVDGDVLRAATAQGYGPVARFWAVELPLAGPVLLAGLRVVVVSTVSLVTVGGVLGVPSLGMLFVDGFQRGITAEILAGIVLTAAIALALDGLLVLAGRALMPWASAGKAPAEPSPAGAPDPAAAAAGGAA